MHAGTVTTLDYPGANTTFLARITDAGDIIGFYFGADGPPGHGFLLTRSGTFEPIDYPGAIGTRPRGLNARGEIVGWYVDANNVTHGFAASEEEGDLGGEQGGD